MKIIKATETSILFLTSECQKLFSKIGGNTFYCYSDNCLADPQHVLQMVRLPPHVCVFRDSKGIQQHIELISRQQHIHKELPSSNIDYHKNFR